MTKKKVEPIVKKDELRSVVYAILKALPSDLLVDYAHEQLNLMTYDDAMESAAGNSELKRECFD